MTTRLVPLASVAALSLALLSGCSFFPSAGSATVDSGDVANAAEDWLDDDEDVKYSVECEDEEVTLEEDESVDCVATDRDTDLEYDVEITITDVDGDDFEVEVDRDSDPRESDDSNDDDSEDSDSNDSGSDDVFDLVVGDCFNDAESLDGDESVSSVDIVDCDETHQREVYASYEFDGDDDDYPGETSVTDDADEFCIDAFDGFVGISYEDSVLYYLTFYPTADSWSEGDREVLCLISEYDSSENLVEVEGSLEDAAR